jgi:hypothetical protein
MGLQRLPRKEERKGGREAGREGGRKEGRKEVKLLNQKRYLHTMFIAALFTLTKTWYQFRSH